MAVIGGCFSTGKQLKFSRGGNEGFHQSYALICPLICPWAAPVVNPIYRDRIGLGDQQSKFFVSSKTGELFASALNRTLVKKVILFCFNVE